MSLSKDESKIYLTHNNGNDYNGILTIDAETGETLQLYTFDDVIGQFTPFYDSEVLYFLYDSDDDAKILRYVASEPDTYVELTIDSAINVTIVSLDYVSEYEIITFEFRELGPGSVVSTIVLYDFSGSGSTAINKNIATTTGFSDSKIKYSQESNFVALQYFGDPESYMVFIDMTSYEITSVKEINGTGDVEFIATAVKGEMVYTTLYAGASGY